MSSPWLVSLILAASPLSLEPSDPPPPPTSSSTASAEATDGGFVGDVEVVVPGSTATNGGGRPSPTPRGPTVVPAGSAACPVAERFEETTDLLLCSGPSPGPAVVTAGLVRRAFAELKLPAGRLVIQPPDGVTLVNFDTNFYTTTTDPISRTVTLLGQQVTLEATPDLYRWDFGDGDELTTTDPGAAYPALRITHNYLTKGSYRPSLSTTYTGRYRINGSEWRQIPGTVTIDGTGQPLRAIEAQPKLVGY